MPSRGLIVRQSTRPMYNELLCADALMSQIPPLQLMCCGHGTNLKNAIQSLVVIRAILCTAKGTTHRRYEFKPPIQARATPSQARQAK